MVCWIIVVQPWQTLLVPFILVELGIGQIWISFGDLFEFLAGRTTELIQVQHTEIGQSLARLRILVLFAADHRFNVEVVDSS